MQLNFSKYQGTGNDFVIIDNREEKLFLTTNQVALLCDRRFGIGADGLMLLEKHDGFDFKMVYYNSDGRESSMCGNGGRCLVKFAYDMGTRKEKYHFLAVDGPHEATLNGDEGVRLKMKDVSEIEQIGPNFVIDTGSPHFVLFAGEIERADIVTQAKAIRFNERFAEKGINVNFVEKRTDDIFVRTYERGVEAETLSCGTGVTASAIAAVTTDGRHHIKVSTPGGKLSVFFVRHAGKYDDIWLCGPAEKVFDGVIIL